MVDLLLRIRIGLFALSLGKDSRYWFVRLVHSTRYKKYASSFDITRYAMIEYPECSYITSKGQCCVPIVLQFL